MHYFIPARRVNVLLSHSRSFFHNYDNVAEGHTESLEYFSFSEDSDCSRALSFSKMFPSPGRRSRKSLTKSVDDMTFAQEKESTRTPPSPQLKEIIKSSPSPQPLDIEEVIKSFSSLNIDEQTTTPKVEKVTRMRMSPKITELVKLPPSQEVDIEATETSLPVAVHIASQNIEGNKFPIFKKLQFKCTKEDTMTRFM